MSDETQDLVDEGDTEKAFEEEDTKDKDPEWLIELREKAKPEWFELLPNPESGAILSQSLQNEFPADEVSKDGTDERRTWELIGVYFRAHGRWHDAIAIYSSMYHHFLRLQLDTSVRVHKGMPLVWIADCYLALGNIPLSKRYMMLTLIEDAITTGGNVDPVDTGSYFRLAWRHGVPDVELKRYSQKAHAVSLVEPINSAFPEFVLQELDTNWIIEVPTPNDIGLYIANPIYIDFLVGQLGEKTGKVLERLAEYLLSCVPGCRTARRQRTYSTDYDIVCSLEGPEVDFRSDFGRYFVCECKDWKEAADFTVFAKFARVLDSMKAQFGIIFSKNGISGEGSAQYAD